MDSENTGLIALSVTLNMMGVSVSADEIRRQSGMAEKFDISDIIKGAESCGLMADHIKTSDQRMKKLQTPFIATMKDGEFVTVASISNDTLLVYDPVSESQQSLALKDFVELWRGDVILLRQQSEKKSFDFGLHWFWPALTRYRLAFSNIFNRFPVDPDLRSGYAFIYHDYYRQGTVHQWLQHARCIGVGG